MGSFKQLVDLVRARLGAFLMSVLLLGVSCPAIAARSTHPATDALTQASEIAEQLSENAPSIDATTFMKNLSEIGALDTRLDKALSPDRKKAFAALVTGIRSAWGAGDRSAVGVQSIEAYRLLQEAVPRGPKAMPVQVAQLDYVGFKVNALLSSGSVNWAELAETVGQASTWWAALEPRTSDGTLKEAMNRTLLAMKEAADAKDAKVMHFAADMELILVDGLESAFTARRRAR